MAVQFANALTGDDLDDDDLARGHAGAPGAPGAPLADATRDGDGDDDDDEDEDDDLGDPGDLGDLGDLGDAEDDPERDHAPVALATTEDLADWLDDGSDPALGDRTLAEHAGELALDDEASGATQLTSDELGFASTRAGAFERAEAQMRRRRTSILGRLDIAIAWRSALRAPMHAPPHADHELWLLATWSP